MLRGGWCDDGGEEQAGEASALYDYHLMPELIVFTVRARHPYHKIGMADLSHNELTLLLSACSVIPT